MTRHEQYRIRLQARLERQQVDADYWMLRLRAVAPYDQAYRSDAETLARAEWQFGPNVGHSVRAGLA